MALRKLKGQALFDAVGVGEIVLGLPNGQRKRMIQKYDGLAELERNCVRMRRKRDLRM